MCASFCCDEDEKEKKIIYNSKQAYNKQTEIGGKAANLSFLERHTDVDVPRWIVLPEQYFWKFLGNHRAAYEKILKTYSPDKHTQLIALLRQCDFGHADRQEILDVVRRTFTATTHLAVRSSALDEDGKQYSFAGMLESYLNIDIQQDDIIKYIKQCYLSNFSTRIMNYRLRNHLIDSKNSLAVIIQEFIDADYAGVMFTTNPQTNNPDQIFLSLVPGKGEALVSGSRTSTDFVVDGTKIEKLTQDSLEISGTILQNLAQIGRQIEQVFRPQLAQDIEFAVRQQKIFIIQTRPITNYAHIDKSQPRTLLDNANIIESYSGVTTPLTFSFASEVYAKIYEQTLREFKIDERAIRRIKPDLKNMLAFYDNKIYYNMNSWYKMTALYPGYNKNKRYMENMMGAQSARNDIHQAKTHAVSAYTHFAKRLLTMKRDSAIFLKKFNDTTEDYYNNDFVHEDNRAILKIYKKLENEILDDFITPIANDMGAMVFLGLLTDCLRRKVGRYDVDDLLVKILGQQGNIESTKQAKALLQLVQAIQQDEEAHKLFIENNCQAQILKNLKNRHTGIYKIFQDYLYQYGPRSINELKLETVTMQQDPLQLIMLLQQYLKTPEKILQPQQQSDETITFADPVLKILIKITKYFVRNRELLRLRRTYIYSIVRNLFLALGRNLAREKKLATARDIFFLTKNELFDLAKGKDSNQNIKALVRRRKRELKDNAKKETFDRMYFYGDISAENMLPIYNTHISDDETLSGIAGGGGTVIGKIQIVDNPDQINNLDGKILLAKRTDPGWTTLFPMIKALIIERGSILSHSAVIAREMGLPLIVNVPYATAKLQNDMLVEIDGHAGTIKILEGEQK